MPRRPSNAPKSSKSCTRVRSFLDSALSAPKLTFPGPPSIRLAQSSRSAQVGAPPRQRQGDVGLELRLVERGRCASPRRRLEVRPRQLGTDPRRPFARTGGQALPGGCQGQARQWREAAPAERDSPRSSRRLPLARAPRVGPQQALRAIGSRLDFQDASASRRRTSTERFVRARQRRCFLGRAVRLEVEEHHLQVWRLEAPEAESDSAILELGGQRERVRQHGRTSMQGGAPSRQARAEATQVWHRRPQSRGEGDPPEGDAVGDRRAHRSHRGGRENAGSAGTASQAPL